MAHHRVSEEIKTYFDELRLKLAFHMSYSFLFVFIILTYSYSFDSIESTLTMGLGVLLSLICVSYVHRFKKYNLVFWIYSIAGVTVTSYALLFFHQTIHLVDVLWMLAGTSLAFFGIGKKLGYTLLIFSILIIAIFIFFSLNIHIVTVKPRNTYQQISLLLEMITGFGLNFYLFYMFTNLYRFSNEKLNTINQQLLEQNQKIKLQNEEKTTLVKEIHHRVKNNLQIVVSLLRLQSDEIDNEEIKHHFQTTINRVMSMALVHQKLYQNESLSRVKLSQYIKDLTDSIVDSFQLEKQKIEIHIDSEIEKIGLKSLIPIGLIINELVTNSFKYAFFGKESGNINILVKKHNESPSKISLIYSDNGEWLEDETSKKNYGSILIETLVDQLDGKLDIHKSNDGTTYQLTFQDISDSEININ